jgi:hypothetical protein
MIIDRNRIDTLANFVICIKTVLNSYTPLLLVYIAL